MLKSQNFPFPFLPRWSITYPILTNFRSFTIALNYSVCQKSNVLHVKNCFNVAKRMSRLVPVKYLIRLSSICICSVEPIESDVQHIYIRVFSGSTNHKLSLCVINGMKSVKSRATSWIKRCCYLVLSRFGQLTPATFCFGL